MKNPLIQAHYFISETDPLRLPHALAEVAFVGRSNAGKSSLLCALCENKKLARVSKMPGRTRAINVFEVKRNYWMVDLPGYGYANAPEKERNYWPTMIGHYLGGRPNLKCVYVLVDSEAGLSPLDQSLTTWLTEKKVPYRLVGTKVDKLSRPQQIEHRAAIAKQAGIAPDQMSWASAKHGYGIKEVQRHVMDVLL